MRTNVPGGVRVVALDAEGARVDAVRLGHGADPVRVLAERGWAASSARFAQVGADGTLELGYAVSPATGEPPPAAPVRRDPDVEAAEAAEPYQRVAAYAVVTSRRGLLLTQFTDRTNVEGEWGLPGGGLDDGEAPADGVHREVWEETGQRVDLGGLLLVQSSHWLGRAPGGGVEDFHAVRIVYTATCAEPTDPVVHDVGGTTGDARWVAPHQLDAVPLTSSWRGVEALRTQARRDYDAP